MNFINVINYFIKFILAVVIIAMFSLLYCALRFTHWFANTTKLTLKFLKQSGPKEYKKIQKHTKGTAFQLAKNLTTRSTQKNKLFTTYRDYAEYIKNIIDGQPNQIFPGRPTYYVTTTGSSAKPGQPNDQIQKKIPFFTKTNDLNYPLSTLLPLISWRITNYLCFGKICFFFRMGNTEEYNGVRCANGVTTQMLKVLNTNIGPILLKRSSISPFEIYKHDDPLYKVMDVHMIYALLEKNTNVFSGYFSRSVLEQFDNLITNHANFVQALKTGEYRASDNEVFRFKPNYTRALELEQLFKKFNPKGWVKQLWPKLDMIVCGASGSFKVYLPRLKYYTNGVDIFSPFCASTESFFGLNLGNYDDDLYHFDTRLGVVHTDNDLFYEGEKYLRLVVSTKNGLDRYLIDDIISPNKTSGTFYYEGRFNFYEQLGITERVFVITLTNVLKEKVHDYIIVNKRDNPKHLHLYVELYDNYKPNMEEYFKISSVFGNSSSITMDFTIVKPGTFKKVVDLIESTVQVNPPNKVNPCREQLKIPRLINTEHYLYDVLIKGAN